MLCLLSHSLSLLLCFLEIGSCFFPKSAWTSIFLFYTFFHSWDDRHVPPHPDLRWGLMNISFNFDSPDLSLISRQDYRHESLVPGQLCSFFLFFKIVLAIHDPFSLGFSISVKI
jgi:hypothetical protein